MLVTTLREHVSEIVTSDGPVILVCYRMRIVEAYTLTLDGIRNPETATYQPRSQSIK